MGWSTRSTSSDRWPPSLLVISLFSQSPDERDGKVYLIWTICCRQQEDLQAGSRDRKGEDEEAEPGGGGSGVSAVVLTPES